MDDAEVVTEQAWKRLRNALRLVHLVQTLRSGKGGSPGAEMRALEDLAAEYELAEFGPAGAGRGDWLFDQIIAGVSKAVGTLPKKVDGRSLAKASEQAIALWGLHLCDAVPLADLAEEQKDVFRPPMTGKALSQTVEGRMWLNSSPTQRALAGIHLLWTEIHAALRAGPPPDTAAVAKEPPQECPDGRISSRVRNIARQARTRLDARGLSSPLDRPLITQLVLDRLDEAERDVREVHPRTVVPISGEPGAGKTVMTGQLFDALTEHADFFPLLVLCEDILGSPQDLDSLDNAFGRAYGSATGLTDVIARISDEVEGRVVVLIDTLDFLLNGNTKPIVIELLYRLVQLRVRVVFTCRRHDYDVWLSRLAHLETHVHAPIVVGRLTAEESAEIIRRYIEFHDTPVSGGVETFTRKVLELSSGSTPLREIVANPLLLIMLCDLFGTSGVVPPDLTTTRLCIRYSTAKIASSRRHPEDTLIASQKELIWRRAAQLMWESSADHLMISVPKSSLPIEKYPEAYQDLRSEEVIVSRSNDKNRIGFIHQIIAEYSMALYLRDSEPEQLEELLSGLQNNPNHRWYGWQLVRHLFVVTEERASAEILLGKLDLNQAPAFQAAAFGLTQGFQHELLCELLKYPQFLAELLDALPSVPEDGVLEALEVLTEILDDASIQPHHSRAASVAGTLLARQPSALADKFIALIQKIGSIRSRYAADPKARDLPDEMLKLLLAPSIGRGVVWGDAVLAAARDQIRKCSVIGVRAIIQAHLVQGVPQAQALALIPKVASHDNANKLEGVGVELVENTITWKSGGATAEDEIDLIDFLTSGSGGNKRFRATLGARALHGRPDLRKPFLDAYLDDATDASITPRVDNLIICFQEVVRQGYGSWVPETLTRLALPSSKAALGRLCGLIKVCHSLGLQDRMTIARWFKPAVRENELDPIDAYLRLTLDNEDHFEWAIAVMRTLTVPQQEKILSNLLRELDSLQVASVGTIASALEREQTSSEQPGRPEFTGSFRARLAGRLASSEPARRVELLQLALSDARKTSDQAIKQLLDAVQLSPSWVDPDSLLPHARHQVVGTRVSLLRVVERLVQQHQTASGALVTAWLESARVRLEKGRIVSSDEVISLFDMIHAYLRNGLGNDQKALTLSAEVCETIVSGGLILPGVERALFALLKTAVMHPETSLSRAMAEIALASLASVELDRRSDAFAFARECLEKLVNQMQTVSLESLVEDIEDWPQSNRLLIVHSISRYDPRGMHSSLFDQLIAKSLGDVVDQEIWRLRARDPN